MFVMIAAVFFLSLGLVLLARQRRRHERPAGHLVRGLAAVLAVTVAIAGGAAWAAQRRLPADRHVLAGHHEGG